ATVEAIVHVGTAWRNALFSPACDQLRFGDGNIANDTFMHEFTHGVTNSTSNLVYAYQSGSLNESYSDIMAALFDGDWTEGEDKVGGYIRNLADPPDKGDPDHMLAELSGDGVGFRALGDDEEAVCDTDDPGFNDCGYVHTNSGIPNKAAYL